MRLLIIFFTLLPTILSGQQNYTLSGKVTDSETGEDLIGVSVAVEELFKGTSTNSYGFYSLSVKAGTYSVRYSIIGYKSFETEVDLTEDRVLNIEIAPSLIEMEEVVITADKIDRNISAPEIGIEKLNLKSIEKLPVFFGENDILKTIQLLPGISNSSEGSTGYNVRGGSMGHNLILLDEASVYSPSHLMGFFSVFNSDAINDATVYKGGIPAMYGGRAASVLDITMNNGNSKKFSASGGIGLVSARLNLEGPIIKDKLSFIISGRRTYGDIVAKVLLPDDIVGDDMEFYFYDLNAKINYKLNDKNRIFLSGYFGEDVLELGNSIGTGWGNTTGTLRWNHLFSDRLFSNTSLIYSKFDYGFYVGQNNTKLKTGIEDLSFKEDATWYLDPDNTLKFGMYLNIHNFNPGELTSDENIGYEIILKKKQAYENALYLQNEHKISDRLSANYGLRLSLFFQTGPGWFYQYDYGNEPSDSTYYNSGEAIDPSFNFEPRLTVNYRTGDLSSVKFSYNRMTQYLHLLSNSSAGSPNDIWLPASNNLKPLSVDHFSLGIFRNFLDNSIETSVEIYYKNMINSADYKDGANIFLNEHVESQILRGKGRSYGLELYIKKKSGVFTGWISYTLSRSENLIEGINDNAWYPMKYDKTNDLSIVTTYNINTRLSLSAVWTYATGNAVTFPSGKYHLAYSTVPYYTERNGYRMPPYHRLDLSLSLSGKKEKKRKSAWDFSVYNAYNRYNAYMITFQESETVPGSNEAIKLSLFGIIPSITYKFKF